MSYTPNSTIHGLPDGNITWNSDFEASRDDKGKWTGSESFTCKLMDAPRLIPSKGTPCQLPGWSFMLSSTVKVDNIEGDLALVTVTYGGVSTTDSETTPTIFTYELGVTTSQEPIETNYRYRALFPLDASAEATHDGLLINLVKTQQWELSGTKAGNTYINSFYKPLTGSITGADLTDPERVRHLQTDLGKELMNFILVEVPNSYLFPGQIWRSTYMSSSAPSAVLLNKVGKIVEDPKGAPTVASDRNWLFIGCNSVEQDGVHTITEEYQLSDEGGWNDKLYTKA